MKILIDIGHPAHVHYFKHFAQRMIEKQNDVLFICRDKDVTIDLLKHYNFRYISLGKSYTSVYGKVFGLFWFTLKLFLISLKFKPDILLNATFYSAFVARLLSKPHISIEDTFNKESTRLFMPFTSVVLTGNYPHPSLGKKEIKYSGYQELLYLHPNTFKPLERGKVYNLLGLDKSEKYVILRFISWNASHDLGQEGLNIQVKQNLVKFLEERKFKVFISVEGKLPESLKKHQLKIPPVRIHDVLSYAEIYVGEGATMASECAILGTPAIYINSMNAGTIDEQEKYGLLFHFRNSEGVMDKVAELLQTPKLKKQWQNKRDLMLANKIDVNAFFTWFIENYPESGETMLANPDYQLKFRT